MGDTLLYFREAMDFVKLFLDLEMGLTDRLMTDAFSRDKDSNVTKLLQLIFLKPAIGLLDLSSNFSK